MSGDKINQSGANTTGKSAGVIAAPGFDMPEPDVNCDDSGEPCLIEKIDWDQLDLDRYLDMCG